MTIGYRMITELFVQKYEHYLPTAFNESMSLLQKVNKILEQLAVVIQNTNEFGDLVSETVNTHITVVGNALQAQDEEIAQIQTDVAEFIVAIQDDLLPANLEITLDNWFLNGKLAKVINENVFDMKADVTYVDSNIRTLDAKILSQASGSPKGTYATVSALQTAYPTGNTNIYVVTADGNWYYWSSTNWVVGGLYQGMVIADGSLTHAKFAFPVVEGVVSKNLFNPSRITPAMFLNSSNGTTFDAPDYHTSEYIPVESSTVYSTTYLERIAMYDENKVFNTVFVDNKRLGQITTPSNAKFMRFSNLNEKLNTTQFERSNVQTPFEKFGGKVDNSIVKKGSLTGDVFANSSISVDKIEQISRTKNIFDKSTAIIGQYIGGGTGALMTNALYFASDFIPVLPNTVYNRSFIGQGAFYGVDKTFQSGLTMNDPASFTTPNNASYIRISDELKNLDIFQVELGSVITAYESFGYMFKNLLVGGSEQSVGISNKLYTLNDAFINWRAGQKFPVAFSGDSTYDGNATTGWVANVIGTDSTSPNAFSKVFQDLLRLATGNQTLRIYNAGFSGSTASDPANMTSVYKGSSPYSDVKMIGIGWGINDRVLQGTEKEYYDTFKAKIEVLINWCYSNSIQPFLLTTQMAVAPDVMTAYTTQYPLRTASHINAIANEVKRDLAKEYNLELIDFNEYTERFALYSAHSLKTIISDQLHFGDVGHKYEAEVLFKEFNPYTINVLKRKQIDYSTQSLVKGVPEDLITMPTTLTDSFKVFANYAKGDSVDTMIFKAYVFIDTDKKMALNAYKSDLPSLTYVKVNGVITALNTLTKKIADLDLGLHTIEVWSGASTKVDFKGFILE